MGLPWWLGGKESAFSTGYPGSLTGQENPLQE